MLEPLRIEWRLATPIKVGERPLHLDALLAFARVQQALREGRDQQGLRRYHDELPLGRVGDSTNWVWQASALHITPASTPFITIMTRRTDYEQLARDRGRLFPGNLNVLMPGTGPMKQYLLRHAFQWTNSVEAFCVGQKQEITDLLSSITHLGGIRRNDWGRITSLTVEADKAAETRWRERALPESLAQYCLASHRPSTGTCRPPYHDRTQWQNIFEII
jgi:CRISPR type IV-associated protein Csf3